MQNLPEANIIGVLSFYKFEISEEVCSVTQAKLSGIAHSEAVQPDHAIVLEKSDLDLQHHALFEANPQPMWIYDLETLRFLTVNNAAVQAYGYSRDEFLAMTIKDIRPAEDVPRLLENISVVTDGLNLAGNWRHIKKDGSIIDVEITSHTLTYRGRAAELVMAYNISARKEIEKALRRSEDRYRAVSELTSDFAYAFRVEPDGQLLTEWVTGALDRITGFSATELRQRGGWSSLLLPEDLPVAEGQLAALLQGKPSVVEYRIVTKNGEIRWMCDHARPAWDATEMRTTYIFGAVRDITDRKQADTKIKESQTTLLNILDSIAATIYVADMGTHEILFMNQYMKESFGGNFIGQICWQAFRHGTRPCDFCTNPRLLDEAGNPSGVVIWEGQNPVTGRWYVNYDRAIVWMDGRRVRLQVATDITKIKELEAERSKTEAQLRQSQKMEAIGTLAGGIAHDFNNILSAIIGYTELSMLEVEDNSPLRQNLEQVFQAGKRARDMVKQILAFSRQSDLERKPIAVNPVVKEALKMLRASLPTTIEIRQDMADNSPIIEADASQLHQVLMNLSTNAAHAMRAEGGVLEVQVGQQEVVSWATSPHAELRPGGYLKLSVRDTGHGIPKENLSRIFDPYFSTKDKSEGTGLGLAVVQGIIKAHGGAITVESTVGKGTTFDIYLPRIDKPMVEKSVISSTLPMGNERILLVDDELALVEIGKQLLTHLGYQTETRTSSVEALSLFRDNPQRFDIIISDMTMPNMTGDKLAREMMAIRPDIPIILCTGYSQRLTEAQAKEMGIRAFIMKPLVVGDLAAVIRTVLQKDG
jgi:PAS domain S-box-containing protein